MTDWYWRRFYVGHWTGAAASWVTPEQWEACRAAGLLIAADATTIAGVDIGRKRDTSAVVAATKVDERIVVRATVFASPGRGSDQSSDLAVIEEHLRDLARRYDLAEIAYDPRSFARRAQPLADEGLPMVEYAQSASRMAPASARLLDAIKSRRLAHDGDEIPALACVGGRDDGERSRLEVDERKVSSPIDALIALVLAVDRLEDRVDDDGIPELLVAWR